MGRAIRKHLHVLIALNLVPPATNEWIDVTYAMGVDALYYDSDFLIRTTNPAAAISKSTSRGSSKRSNMPAQQFPTGAVLYISLLVSSRWWK